MKKLLLASVACGALAMATPASANDHGVKLDLGGHLKGYAVYNDQDEDSTVNTRDLDILRETEIHFNGEKTLDNGLTVGVHVEADLDSGDDAKLSGGNEDIVTEESYVYFSGGWGRVNFGQEDGAAYLLQVAAPSADSNIDGLRQYIQPVNYQALTDPAELVGAANTLTGAPFNLTLNSFRFDYDQAVSAYDNKVTYITPVFSGFQAGISYTPELNDTNEGLGGVSLDDETDAFGDVFDVAARYEGKFEELGFALGAGYTEASLEEETGSTTFSDDRTVWNVGLDMDWGPFGLGVVYKEDDGGRDAALFEDEEIIVVGADYNHGPYKLGASYYTADNTFAIEDFDTDRYAAGLTYTYGPGMTFRGSVQYIDHDTGSGSGTFADASDDADATSILLGTQINF